MSRLGAARSCPGAARSGQEPPEAAGSRQELPGADRSCQELPGAARSRQELPGAARSRRCRYVDVPSSHTRQISREVRPSAVCTMPI